MRFNDRGNRLCARCKEYRPITEFSPAPDGYQAYCRKCGLEKNAEWREKHRPRKDGLPARANRPKKTKEEKELAKLAYNRVFREKNRDKIRWWNKLRLHRQRSSGPMPDRWEIGRLICKQNAQCTYCKRFFYETGGYEIEHKTPVSRGGDNHITNLQLVCAICNMKKGRKTHEEYLAKLGWRGQLELR